MDEQEDRLHPLRDEISWLVRTTAASLNNDPVRREEREVQETYLPGCSELCSWGGCLGGVHTDPGQEEPPSGCHRETKLPSRCCVAMLTRGDRFGAFSPKHLSPPYRFLVFASIHLINIHGRAVRGAGHSRVQDRVPALVYAGLMHPVGCTCPQGGETLSGSRAGAWVPKDWAMAEMGQGGPPHLHGPVLREACHPCPDSSPPFPGGLRFPGGFPTTHRSYRQKAGTHLSPR